VPVTLRCTAIWSAQQVYNYNPNFVADQAYQPSSGSDAARVAGDQGATCGWVDETSSAVLAIGVAQPTAANLASLKLTASNASRPVSVGSGATGYFSAHAGVGEFQMFTAKYWVVMSSADFTVSGDVTPIAQVVAGNLAGH
jgi:hypothetical protein